MPTLISPEQRASAKSFWSINELNPAVLADMVALARPTFYESAPDSTKSQIIHEQACGLFAVTLYAAYYTIISAAATAVGLLSSVPILKLVGWFGIIVVLSIARHLLSMAFFKKQPTNERLSTWIWLLWAVTAAIGAIWAILPWLVWHVTDLSALVFVGFVLSATVFFAYGTLGVHSRFYLGFALPVCIGLACFLAHVMPAATSVPAVGVLIVLMFGSGFTTLKASRIWRSTFVLVHQHHDLSNLHQQESLVLATILKSISDGVLTIDRSGRISYINPAAERLTGVSIQDSVGKKLSESFKLKDEASENGFVDLDAIVKQVRVDLRVPGDLLLTSLRVKAISVEVTISPLLNSNDADVQGYVITIRDATSARMLARDLSHQALHDPLTDILNRRGFENILNRTLHHRLEHASGGALCVIDLDRFKKINDTCGHQAGDLLLKQVVELIRSIIRDTDSFARLGGDEFAILFHGCTVNKASDIAQKICDAVGRFQFCWENETYSVGTSIGIAPIVGNDTPQDAMRAADVACYQAKSEGRGRVCVNTRA